MPSSRIVYWNEAWPLKFAADVNNTLVPDRLTVPPTALPTAVIVSAWPASSAGPAESLASRVANEIVRGPLSSATLAVSVSPAATGASLTAATLSVTLAVLVSPLASVIL